MKSRAQADSGAGLNAIIGTTRGNAFDLDIELIIEPGTTAALLGPNGAGKSTTVELLAGLRPIESGRILLGGRVLDAPAEGVFVPAERRRVGVVFQRYLLFEHLSVMDNIAFGPSSSGRSKRDARAVVARWVDTFDLGPLVDRRPSQLSGGQAQRVALARALASEPQLLLLDEPMAALDVTTRAELRRMLRTHLVDFNGPRLLITHDPSDAFLLADHIHILEDGRITQSGTPADLRRHPATAYAAALAGTNLLFATNVAGTLTLEGHEVSLQTFDTHTTGSVQVTIHPSAIALHLEQPHGSPRNTWSTTVVALEPLGDVTRVMLGAPLPLRVDITPASASSLDLGPGVRVWASVKATEITVTPA